ncbi:hypothetical protein B0H13DRAFT_1871289 [Mycena leptocephala]|nr:hypothetical protein B0H13DRAFT_1871289 [Mycena leptocephala]
MCLFNSAGLRKEPSGGAGTNTFSKMQDGTSDIHLAQMRELFQRSIYIVTEMRVEVFRPRGIQDEAKLLNVRHARREGGNGGVKCEWVSLGIINFSERASSATVPSPVLQAKPNPAMPSAFDILAFAREQLRGEDDNVSETGSASKWYSPLDKLQTYGPHIAECRNDWKDHKSMCKALSSLEKKSFAAATLVSLLPKESTLDNAEFLSVLLHCSGIGLSSFCASTDVSKTSDCNDAFLGYGDPHGDRDERHDGGRHETLDSPPAMHAQLLLLTRALGGAARKLHQGPSEVLRDGLSQYHMNKSTRGQIMFETTMTSWLDRQRPLVLIPKRVKPVWVSLKGEFWQGEFSDEVRKSFGMPAPLPITFLITAASDTLSMPMTILYGLEKLSDDDGWTRKNTSTIHILGADIKEVSCSPVFEEFLYRPRSEDTERTGHIDEGINQCANSSSYAVRTYLGATRPTTESVLIAWRLVVHMCSNMLQSNKFENPDLYIGFNSGRPRFLYILGRRPSKLLAERKLPSLFTLCRCDKNDARIHSLTTVASALGPALNPWGSIKGVPTTHSVYGFQAENG